MKFYIRSGTTIVEAEILVKIAGFISGGRVGMQKAKAVAFFPFVIVRNQEYATPVFINHEKIHWRQQWELLFIGMPLLRIFEDCYSGFVLGLAATDRYLYRATEQEAYRN